MAKPNNTDRIGGVVVSGEVALFNLTPRRKFTRKGDSVLEWTVVTQLPTCDIHKYVLREEGVTARFDARGRDGRWGNFCVQCWVGEGSPIGLGRGQLLVTQEERDRK